MDLIVTLIWQKRLNQAKQINVARTSLRICFGDWDLRRETIVRPTDLSRSVERFEIPNLQDEDELTSIFQNRYK